MAVAKSYQKLTIVTDPYVVNGRMYVQVELANGCAKQVRWYSDKEYAKMYGEPVDHTNDPFYKTQKEILGFKNGYITIFKGDTYSCKEELKSAGATYTKWWGWSFASTVELPETLPEGITPIRLDWDSVGDGDTLKNDDFVKAVVEALIFEPSDSEFQGQIGERLELDVTVIAAIPLNGYYGMSIMHIMEDSDKNIYVWTTSSKNWQEGSVHAIKGTVKDHKVYKNVRQTILTRCAERKK